MSRALNTTNKRKKPKPLSWPLPTAASSTSTASYTPPPPMLSIDNTGVARIKWSGEVTVWRHDGATYISANGIKVTIR